MDEVALLKPKLTRLKLAGMLDTLTERLQQAMARSGATRSCSTRCSPTRWSGANSSSSPAGSAKAASPRTRPWRPSTSPSTPTIHAPTLRELATCRFVARAENVFLVGPSGVGKSHAAQALGHVACRKGYEVTYERTSVLFDWLHAGRGDGSYARRLRQIATVALLVLDLSRPCDYPDAGSAGAGPPCGGGPQQPVTVQRVGIITDLQGRRVADRADGTGLLSSWVASFSRAPRSLILMSACT